MKWWPKDPEDSKNLHISLIGGLSVAIILITKDLFILFGVDSMWFNIFILFVLWCMFIYFINNYKKIREGLDNIHKSTQKSK